MTEYWHETAIIERELWLEVLDAYDAMSTVGKFDRWTDWRETHVIEVDGVGSFDFAMAIVGNDLTVSMADEPISCHGPLFGDWCYLSSPWDDEVELQQSVVAVIALHMLHEGRARW